MFNAELFCNEYNIDYAKSGKHARPGWVNISCPFCSGHAGFHGGFNIENSYYNCHRCGSHYLPKVIAVLTGSSQNTAATLIKKYSTLSEPLSQRETKKKAPSKIIFPSDTGKLTNKAKIYLINRLYNPDKLETIWNLKSTSHIGFYKNRILAPIYQRQELVSYQTRDITDKHPQKYLACFQDEEIIQHQHCIYGLDQAVSRRCIVVEGITDVWRLGPGAVATFGIDFTKQQARLIATNFNKVFIMFDSEPQAQEKAKNLAHLISSAFTNSVKVINLSFIIENTDPGDLSQNDADSLMKEIKL
jgi:transposase-like protein